MRIQDDVEIAADIRVTGTITSLKVALNIIVAGSPHVLAHGEPALLDVLSASLSVNDLVGPLEDLRPVHVGLHRAPNFLNRVVLIATAFCLIQPS